MDHASIYLILTAIFCFLMAWGVGANDVANAMGTSVGSKALSIKQAIIIAAIFEFSGALLAGGEVTHTISSGITSASSFAGKPELLIYGMMASLLSAAIWLYVASYFGWPVSTTHTVIGSIVGFTSIGIGAEAVHWDEVGRIVSSWVLSPLIGGIFAYTLFTSMRKLIFNAADPFSQAKRYVPVYIFFAAFILVMVTTTKGLRHLGLHYTFADSFLLSLGAATLITLLGIVAVRRIGFENLKNQHRRRIFVHVERVFAVLMAFTACAMAFAHGSNDVANAVGPMAAVLSVVSSGKVGAFTYTPIWVLLMGGIGIIAGLSMYGHKVIATVGSGITQLTPSRGFAATLSAATTVVLASGTGLPISTTHTLVGAVFGVGLARGLGALNLRVIRNIIVSWLVTLPAGAVLAIVLFYLLKFFFTHLL